MSYNNPLKDPDRLDNFIPDDDDDDYVSPVIRKQNAAEMKKKEEERKKNKEKEREEIGTLAKKFNVPVDSEAKDDEVWQKTLGAVYIIAKNAGEDAFTKLKGKGKALDVDYKKISSMYDKIPEEYNDEKERYAKMCEIGCVGVQKIKISLKTAWRNGLMKEAHDEFNKLYEKFLNDVKDEIDEKENWVFWYAQETDDYGQTEDYNESVKSKVMSDNDSLKKKGDELEEIRYNKFNKKYELSISAKNKGETKSLNSLNFPYCPAQLSKYEGENNEEKLKNARKAELEFRERRRKQQEEWKQRNKKLYGKYVYGTEANTQRKLLNEDKKSEERRKKDEDEHLDFINEWIHFCNDLKGEVTEHKKEANKVKKELDAMKKEAKKNYPEVFFQNNYFTDKDVLDWIKLKTGKRGGRKRTRKKKRRRKSTKKKCKRKRKRTKKKRRRRRR